MSWTILKSLVNICFRGILARFLFSPMFISISTVYFIKILLTTHLIKYSHTNVSCFYSAINLFVITDHIQFLSNAWKSPTNTMFFSTDESAVYISHAVFWDIYDVFKLIKPFSLHGLNKNISALKALSYILIPRSSGMMRLRLGRQAGLAHDLGPFRYKVCGEHDQAKNMPHTSHIPHHATYPTSSHTSNIIPHIPHHATYATSRHAPHIMPHIMPHIPHHTTHPTLCHTSHTMPHIPNHATYHVANPTSCHASHIMPHTPHHDTHFTTYHTSCHI